MTAPRWYPLRTKSAPHQVYLHLVGSGPLIALTCNCRTRGRAGWLAARVQWTDAELAVIKWAHLAETRAA